MRSPCPLLLLTALLLPSCASPPTPSAPSSLPEYARPQAETLRPDQYTATDVTRYRAVSREDFRAERPPVAIGDNARNMGAFTCANIVPEGDPQVSLTTRSDGARVARVERAHFHAEMDRGCSWWNDAARRDPTYILEHEQIHFALTEIQARRLTEQLRALEVVVRDPRRASARIQREYDRLARESSEALVRESTRFDEETSFRFAPDAQRRWLRYVEQELAATAP
jgi:hypothetical protein